MAKQVKLLSLAFVILSNFEKVLIISVHMRQAEQVSNSLKHC